MKTMMKNATYGSTPIIDATAGIGYANSSVSNGYVYEGVINTANGYPFYSTSHMNSGNLIYGNWADLLIANWSGLDITVDPYTQALLGTVRLVINSYWSFVKRRTASFAKNTMY
jgi:hypothetical protein